DISNLRWVPAQKQLELFRSGAVSATEVLRAQMERCESEGPHINVITYSHFDEALSAARESETRYRSGKARPLEGITVAVKDEFDRDGWTVTSGSRLQAARVANIDHPIIRKLLDAGAILHIQTTAPEFFLIAETWSD